MKPEIDHDWTSAFQDFYPEDNPTPMVTSRAIDRLAKEKRESDGRNLKNMPAEQ